MTNKRKMHEPFHVKIRVYLEEIENRGQNAFAVENQRLHDE